MSEEKVPRKAEIVKTDFIPIDEIERENSLAELAERSILDRLQGMEDASAIFRRRGELLETCYMTAIRRTRPEDWVLFRAPDGSTTAMLAASGADLVAELYGIVIRNVRPVDDSGMFRPERTAYASGAYALRGTCDAFSRFNGRYVEGLECSRRSDEDFTGRGVDAGGKIETRKAAKVGALDGDLRASVLTLLRTKAVRVLAGMVRVPIADLQRGWQGTDRKIDTCRRGHGFGAGDERRAEAVAEGGVSEQAELLRQEILRRVGGDEPAAQSLLLEITKKEKTTKSKGFSGFKSTKQFTQAWQLDGAWQKLRAHSTFGDAQQGPPGEGESEHEREPGEETIDE